MKQLSAPVARRLLHTRQVECTGWERDDGRFDVEGRLSDVRALDSDDRYGNAARRAGDPVHLMSLRITVDDTLTILEAEAVSHQTPYADCPEINDAYRELVGLKIEGGFHRAVQTRFRGARGCTHLTELLGPIATTALQTIWPALERRRAAAGSASEIPTTALLDSCHALRRGGEAAVIRWGRAGEARPANPG